MSEYRKNKTNYKDRECLVKALNEQGYTNEMIELHEQPQQLYDYCGHATHYLDADGDKAEIIVRRKYVGGAANDLGFKKEADGTYSAIVSAYDSSKHNTKWMDGLKRAYGEAVIHKTAKRLNLKPYASKVVNGRKQIQYMAV